MSTKSSGFEHNDSFSPAEEESDDIASAHEAAESAEIFRKYESAEMINLPRQSSDDFDYDIYSRTDRFGFTHEKDQILESNEDDKAKIVELRRERKWLKMLFRWPKYQGSPRLKRSIYKGVPQKFRAEVWRRLLNIDGQKVFGTYDKLRLRARLCAKDTKQIDMDINRTYRNHVFFRQRYGIKQRSLLNVLAAYSLFNRDLGYCQGMNHLAALLLMYFVEEDAFWALHILMCDNGHAMHGFFMPGFPKLLRFQQHHDAILKKRLPNLRAHLESQGVHTALYTTKWFFQCFLDRVPFSLALRLWDIYMLEGDVVLTAMAFTILKLHQKYLMKLNFEQTMEFLQVRLEKSFGAVNDVVVEALIRVETPVEPVGTILSEPFDWEPCSMSVNLSTSKENYLDQIGASLRDIRGNVCDGIHSRQFNKQVQSAQQNGALEQSSPTKAGLAHVPSYYDNLEKGFCSCSGCSNDVGCEHDKVTSVNHSTSSSADDCTFRIETGPDHITRIRIDTQ
uniref:Rab-GAP TBC domain-containing protein n=1 Tax=Trichuris muris TaxID=70415 RepID=A0A5S6QAI2_TRIMR